LIRKIICLFSGASLKLSSVLMSNDNWRIESGDCITTLLLLLYKPLLLYNHFPILTQAIEVLQKLCFSAFRKEEARNEEGSFDCSHEKAGERTQETPPDTGRKRLCNLFAS